MSQPTEFAKRKARDLLAEAGYAAAWELYTAPHTDGWQYEESTIRDIVNKLVEYGSISGKQLSFIGRLLAQIPQRATIAAQRAAEAAAAAPIPVSAGRMRVAGKVLTVKEKETRFGVVLKMLVQSSDGWKVWGTVPTNLRSERDQLRDRQVCFSANVEVSASDPKFGFFSRPSGAQIIETTF